MAYWSDNKKNSIYYEIGDLVKIKDGKAKFDEGFIRYQYIAKKGGWVYAIEPNPFNYDEEPVFLTESDFTLDPSETIREHP